STLCRTRTTTTTKRRERRWSSSSPPEPRASPTSWQLHHYLRLDCVERISANALRLRPRKATIPLSLPGQGREREGARPGGGRITAAVARCALSASRTTSYAEICCGFRAFPPDGRNP